MPACASEGCTTGDARFRSSSPPNSRSDSASPPFKRSFSNLSNSSLPHENSPAFSEHSATDLTTTSSISVQSAERQTHCQRHRPGDCDGNVPVTKRIFRKRYQDYDTGAASGGGGATKLSSSSSSSSSSRRNDERRTRKVALPARLVAWYVNLVLSATRRVRESLSYMIWAPIIWISAWICLFWVVVQLPLHTIKWLILALCSPADERARSKRCVLISGGSTLQALHLARNFHKAGARVVVCEIDGLFGLARFSTACARFYSVPRPAPGAAAEYVDALKRIARTENAVYYVPVSSTVDAYYDALAKPHLEILGCECFVPGAAEITALEDPLRLIRRCAALGLATPVHFVLESPDDLARLYEAGTFAGSERHALLAAGPSGMRERAKFHVPPSTRPADGPPRTLRQRLEQYEMSERRPWVVVREPPRTRGHQLVTCTTVKDSRVVANVTCRLDEARGGLVPEERGEVDQWLEAFFARPFATRINGHLSFKLAFSVENGHGTLFAVGCRVGVPLPYLCLTSVHPRLVWRPCRHFSRQNSASALVNERYKHAGGSASGSTSLPSQPPSGMRANNRLVVTRSSVLDKRDALFVYWDPLPYCAYYHLQLPFRRLAGAIRERPARHKPPLAVVQ